MGDKPAKVLVDPDTISRLKSENAELHKQLIEKDSLLNSIQMTSSAMLEILMSSTDSQRVSTISRLQKKVYSAGLLESIRKANRE